MNALVCLLAGLVGGSDAFEYPPQSIDGLEARLRIEVPEEGVEQGRSRVRLEMSVSGPGEVQLEGPRLEDALAAWRVRRRASSYQVEANRTRCDVTLVLEQVKPGVVPLPGLVLRIRSGPDRVWHEVSWVDLLSEPRDVAPPIELPAVPESSWPGRLRLGGLAFLGILAVGFGLRAAWHRCRVRRPTPAPVRALEALDIGFPSPGERFAHLDRVLRHYLDERFGLATSRQTAAEMRNACRELPEAAQTDLLEFLACCDLVKFGGQQVSLAESEMAADQARKIIRVCEAKDLSGRASSNDVENQAP